MNKNLLIAAFTLAGSMIGAGILGLPYVFAQSGFFIGLFWLVLLTAIILISFLSLGEVSLRVKGNHQLPGYAEKILGKKGRTIMLIAVVFGIFASLISYLIGEGQSLSTLLFGNLKYAFLFALLFWAAMSFLLKKGLKELKKIESYGLILIVLVIMLIFFLFIGKSSPDNFTRLNYSNFFLPFGTILFALLGFTSIPEINLELEDKKQLKNAIIFGVLLSFVMYLIFVITVVGSAGMSVTEVATLTPEFGRFANVLGIFTMLTSYFVLSFSIRDLFLFDLCMTEKKSYYLSIFTPLILFVILTLTKLNSFIEIISIGGAISGGIVGSMVVMMNYKAKKQKLGSPEYQIKMNKWIMGFIITIFVVGILSLFIKGF